MVSAYAIANESEFVQKVREMSEVKQKEEAANLKRKISKAKKRCAELDSLIKRLYESFVAVQLKEKRFELLSSEYEQEQAELEVTIAEDSAKLNEYAVDTERVDQFLAVAKKHTDFSVLTTPMIYEFIDKIIVHAPDRSTGERTQEVEIYLKFIGKFDVPMLEPTAEELERMEKERAKREYYRERGRRQRERERQKKELAKQSEQRA